MKKVVKTSFWQLLLVYSLIVVALSIGLFWKYSLQMNIFAIFIAIIGVFILNQDKIKVKQLSNKTHNVIFVILILLMIILRILPYLNNSVPLGYDPGIYKYGIEHGLANLDNWILAGGLEPGFLYIITALHTVFSSDFLLTYGLIFFSLLLGLTVYLVVKEHSNKETALISLALFTLSVIQFKTFGYMYYKNITGMTLMLLAFYFLKKSDQNKNWLWAFVLTGGLLGSIHRPSFYIFGLSYLIWAFVSPYSKEYEWNKLKLNVLSGAGILIISSLFYVDKFKPAILSMFKPVLNGFIQPGEGPGTFINFLTFQFSILPYLVLALIGLFLFIKRKELNILVVWCVINLAIVYFQFFFFNRFIIFLDLAFIVMASFGVSTILNEKGKVGKVILLILLLSSAILAFQESASSKPLITEQELETIKSLSQTEENAFVMSTNKYYSPWILGYSQRKTIAPGLFDYDNHTLAEWNLFWSTNSTEDMIEFMSAYKKPVYVYVGIIQKDNLEQFHECFNSWSESDGGKIYKYVC